MNLLLLFYFWFYVEDQFFRLKPFKKAGIRNSNVDIDYSDSFARKRADSFGSSAGKSFFG